MKTAILTAVIVVLAVSSAQADGLIASWENQMDHFTTTTNFDGSTFVTDVGVTHGDYALALDFKAGWTQGLRSTDFGATLPSDYDWAFPQLAGATKLYIDVTSSRSMFNTTEGGSLQLALFMQGESIGSGAFNNTYDYLDVSVIHSETTATETLVWDLTKGGTVDPLPDFSPETGGWFDMRIHTNTNVPNPGIVIIDNLRTDVPEPATLCLLGLGVVGLLRRRSA